MVLISQKMTRRDMTEIYVRFLRAHTVPEGEHVYFGYIPTKHIITDIPSG